MPQSLRDTRGCVYNATHDIAYSGGLVVIGFLKRAFSRKHHKVPAAKPVKDAGSSARPTESTESPQLSASHHASPDMPVDLDLCFSAWVIGANSTADTSLSEVESRLLTAVEGIMQSGSDSAELLPRVPAVIPRLLQSLRDENITAAKLAQEIAQDPTIVGEVIRVANSPYYRTAVPTSSLEQALGKLGHGGLRQVIATIAFRSVIDVRSGHFSRTGSPLLWKQTESSAQAARCLAKLEGVDMFDAFLAALVHNLGATVALKVLDKHLDISDAPRSTAFHQKLGVLARRLTHYIVTTWDFPPSVVTAIEEQIHIESADKVSRPGSVLYAADRLSKLLLLVESNRIQVDVDRIICSLGAGRTGSCTQCYQELVALGKDAD